MPDNSTDFFLSVLTEAVQSLLTLLFPLLLVAGMKNKAASDTPVKAVCFVSSVMFFFHDLELFV